MNQINLPQNAYGKIPYNMTNDYMFRAVLQSNNKVLKGLICSLLHLKESEVQTVKITNPILLGDTVRDKEFRLDISVSLALNAEPSGAQLKTKPLRQHINLEMQVANRLNWPNRSVLYLCRTFDSLDHGLDYSDAVPAIHIGFLDYTLFKEQPEFYATYKLINMKNHNIYSDNFVLNVVDLTHIDLATHEDKKYLIDSWASLFKATIWEEILMLASKNEYLSEAVNTIFQLNADEQIRKRCRDREEYYQDLHNYELAIADMKAENAELTAKNQKMTVFIAEKESEAQHLSAKNAQMAAVIMEKEASLTEQNILIQKLISENEQLKRQLKQ